MAIFDQIRDPIIRIYAKDLLQKTESAFYVALQAFYGARKSLLANPRIPDDERRGGYEAYYEAQQVVYREFRILDHRSQDIATAIRELNSNFQKMAKIEKYYLRSRKHFKRHTTIDTALSDVSGTFGAMGTQCFVTSFNSKRRRREEDDLRESFGAKA